MQLRNCPKCGKVYRYDGLHLYCRECLEADEAVFQHVRECLLNEPGLSLSRLAEKAGVEEALILRYIREGRLVAESIADVTLHCESCGKRITEGRFCSACAANLAGGLRPDRSLPTSRTEKTLEAEAARRARISRFYTRERG